MDLRELIEIVHRFTYKPGWRFRVPVEFFAGGQEVILEARVADAMGSEEPIILRATHVFDMRSLRHMSSHEVVLEIQHLVRRLEMHEVDEWLRFDGQHVTDPHPELKLGPQPWKGSSREL